MQERPWHEHLTTGFATIDDQHRAIAERTKELLMGIVAERPHSELEPLVGRLIEVTAHHFATEEGLMLASGYSEFEEHRKEHRRLLEQLDLVNRSLPGGPVAAHEATARFMQTLGEQHVFLSDRRLAQHLNERGFSS